MKSQISTLTVAIALLSAGAAFAQAKAPEPDFTITGNVSLNSDYKFRGFTQTDYGPALQGGFDFAHKSGLYLGNWNSNVLQSLYTGASLEMDFYGGYKGEIAKGLGYDVGAIYYYYPKSGVVGSTKISNTEVYGGLTYGPFSGKLYYATGDYFKAAKLVGAPNSTKGTTYLDLNYSTEVASGLVLGLHAGILSLKENQQFTDIDGNTLGKTVTDYKISLTQDVGGYALTGAIIGTSKKGYFSTGQVGPIEAAGKARLFVSLGKTF